MTKSCCACPECRRLIRAEILAVFARERRWMGPYTIRYEGRLGWVPSGLYLELVTELCAEGLLIYSYGPDDPFPRLLASRLMGRPGSNSGNRCNLRRPLDPEGDPNVA